MNGFTTTCAQFTARNHSSNVTHALPRPAQVHLKGYEGLDIANTTYSVSYIEGSLSRVQILKQALLEGHVEREYEEIQKKLGEWSEGLAKPSPVDVDVGFDCGHCRFCGAALISHMVLLDRDQILQSPSTTLRREG